MTLASTTLGWRLVNPSMNKDWTISLGEATERLLSTVLRKLGMAEPRRLPSTGEQFLLTPQRPACRKNMETHSW
jgi:hypothetical protein